MTEQPKIKTAAQIELEARMQACQMEIEATLKRYGAGLIAVMRYEPQGTYATVQIIPAPQQQQGLSLIQP